MTQNYQGTYYKGPLEGLKVIDFGHYFAGPIASMLLADQGANVIRIVKKGAKEIPEQQFRLLNRNKKLLNLDLKNPEDKAQALALIESADVVIENFRPGVMKRLGLDYGSVKEKNPGLVYLSLPGFSAEDKDRAHLQAWEGVIASAATLHVNGSYVRHKFGYPPVYTWVPLCSVFGAVQGSIAVMAALLAREDNGLGTCIEAPLVDAGLFLFSEDYLFKAVEKWTLPSGLSPAQQASAYSPSDDEETQLKKLSGAFSSSLAYVYQLYRSADNRKLLFHVSDRCHFVERYFNALGIYEQLLEEGFVNLGPWKTVPGNKNLSNSGKMNPEDQKHVIDLIASAVKKRTAAEWEAIMAEVGVPCVIVRTREEWLGIENHRRSGLLVEMADGQDAQTKMTVPGRLVDVCGETSSEAGVLIDLQPQEARSITEDELTAWLAYKSAENVNAANASNTGASNVGSQSKEKGDLLKGLKVLDLTNIVAGPTSAHTLALYGADVIRSEPPDEGFTHPYLVKTTLDVMQGKRSIITDIKTEKGREVFESLIRWADIVLHNVLDNVTERMGISPEKLRELNPNAVGCQLSCGGGTLRNAGGWELRPGFDPIAQLAAGIPAQYGTLEYPQGHGGLSVDLLGGITLAFSSLLARYQQRKTGYAGEGRASLMRAVNYLQLPFMIAINGRSDWGETRGQFSLGTAWWHRLYQCSDGWIFVGGREDQAGLLAEKISGQQQIEANELESFFAQKTCDNWLAALNAADIACHKTLSMDDIYAQGVAEVDNVPANAVATESVKLLQWPNHPGGIPITTPASTWVRIGKQQSYKRLTPAPRVGENTVEILKELGYMQEEIDALLQSKAVHEYLPAMGGTDNYYFPGTV